MKCAVCAAPAQRACSACQFVVYCGDACARSDWPQHAAEAHPVVSIGNPTDYQDENVMDQVWPSIWLGGVAALQHLDKIGAVVTALPREGRVNEKMLARLVGGRPHFRVYWHDHVDQELPVDELCAAVNFIQKQRDAGRQVLVHCWAGHSRSVSIVLFYLSKMVVDGRRRFKTVADGLRHIQKSRPTAGPNEGFLEQLAEIWTHNC